MTIVEGDLKAPYSKTTTPRYRGGHYSLLWIFPLTFDLYLIMGLNPFPGPLANTNSYANG